jgi:hypothetical protein
MHELLFHRQQALDDCGLLRYATQLGRMRPHSTATRPAQRCLRIRRDVDGGLASGQVLGTPTLIIDGVLHNCG